MPSLFCITAGGHHLPQALPTWLLWRCQVLLMEEILHQLIGSLSNYLQGFLHPRVCRISSINSTKHQDPKKYLFSWAQMNGLRQNGYVIVWPNIMQWTSSKYFRQLQGIVCFRVLDSTWCQLVPIRWGQVILSEWNITHTIHVWYIYLH